MDGREEHRRHYHRRAERLHHPARPARRGVLRHAHGRPPHTQPIHSQRPTALHGQQRHRAGRGVHPRRSRGRRGELPYLRHPCATHRQRDERPAIDRRAGPARHRHARSVAHCGHNRPGRHLRPARPPGVPRPRPHHRPARRLVPRARGRRSAESGGEVADRSYETTPLPRHITGGEGAIALARSLTCGNKRGEE